MRRINVSFRNTYWLLLFFSIVSVSIIIVFACTTEKQNTSSRKMTSVHIPKKKSALDGWQGVKVRKCGAKCCELVFPENFGLKNKNQLMALRELVNADLDQDVDCMMLVNKDTLNQIKFLATEKQDSDAAKMLLSPQSYGGFNLDGELAEEFVGEYQLSVLEKFKNLHSILDKNVEEDLSVSICSWVEVLGEEAGQKRVKKLLRDLKSKDFSAFAGMISEKCGQSL